MQLKLLLEGKRSPSVVTGIIDSDGKVFNGGPGMTQKPVDPSVSSELASQSSALCSRPNMHIRSLNPPEAPIFEQILPMHSLPSRISVQ